MTANDAYILALSLLPQSKDDDDSLSGYIVGWVNMFLTDVMEWENTVRIAAGETPLTQAPQITSMSDTLPYCDKLMRVALVYNLASLACKNDDNDYWATDYRNRCIAAIEEVKRDLPGKIVDVYGGFDV